MYKVVFVRHAEVQPQWKSICYGAMDVPLSQHGIEASSRFAKSWASRLAPSCIVHSGLQRTEALARMVSDRFPLVPVVVDPRLRERDYGTWQGRHWDAIFAEHPDLHDLIEQPDTYCPHGGETTSEMQSRVVGALECLQSRGRAGSGPVLAISHSGPMAALAGHCLNLHATQWQPWTVQYLESISFRKNDSSAAAVQVTRHERSG